MAIAFHYIGSECFFVRFALIFEYIQYNYGIIISIYNRVNEPLTDIEMKNVK